MTYYSAEIKTYEDKEKSLVIGLNPGQRKKIREWEEIFKKNIAYRKIEFYLYKNKKELIETIAKTIKTYYEKEEKKHPKEIIEWATKKIKEVLNDASEEENTTIVYTKDIYNTAKRVLKYIKIK